MQQRKILVTGATGKTGSRTVQYLREAGHSVRAMVHREDERSEALKAAGAEVMVGELLNHDDVIRATAGMQGAYLCYPVQPGLIQVTVYFADAARRAGLDVVLNMSQMPAREGASSNAARDHWLSERLLDRSGVPTVHVRPTYMAEWITYPWVRDTILKQGKITLPFGNGRHAPLSASDQGRVLAAILGNPAEHIGKTYPLYGIKELSQAEIASAVGKALGIDVVYSPSTIEEYHTHLQTYPLSKHMIQHFLETAVDYQNGVFSGMNDVVERIIGRPPQTIEEFIADKRHVYNV
ncbi:NmrA family NAD(P)-binding protein [Paraburkholderia sp. C35]|uniref:NmrA family NAD(P)-binding protein n=1 Tax=Paraburkholderia sp. C35 TaxID=2126993 RepID=UPI000D69D161|nr:NmrA family NAD(P)-binding protein [Paraburkholderia sp. C35]